MRREIAEAYLKSRGLRLKEGDIEDDQIFLPYLVMDTVYQIYCRTVKPLPVKHELKRMKSGMRDAYMRFNRGFFRAFTPEMQDEIIDAMDGFDDYIADALTITRAAVSNTVSFLDFDLQMEMTDMLLMNILANSAGIFYHDMFRGLPERYRHEPDIEAMATLAQRFGDAYYKSKGGQRRINPNDVPKIDSSMQALFRRMLQWTGAQRKIDDMTQKRNDDD